MLFLIVIILLNIRFTVSNFSYDGYIFSSTISTLANYTLPSLISIAITIILNILSGLFLIIIIPLLLPLARCLHKRGKVLSFIAFLIVKLYVIWLKILQTDDYYIYKKLSSEGLIYESTHKDYEDPLDRKTCKLFDDILYAYYRDGNEPIGLDWNEEDKIIHYLTFVKKFNIPKYMDKKKARIVIDKFLKNSHHKTADIYKKVLDEKINK